MATILLDQDSKVDFNQYSDENIVEILGQDHQPKAYIISVEMMNKIEDYLEDLELIPIIEERLKEEFIEVNLDDL